MTLRLRLCQQSFPDFRLLRLSTTDWLILQWLFWWDKHWPRLLRVSQHWLIVMIRLAEPFKYFWLFQFLGENVLDITLDHAFWVGRIIGLSRISKRHWLNRCEMLLFRSRFNFEVLGCVWINWTEQVWHYESLRQGWRLIWQCHLKWNVRWVVFLIRNTCLYRQLKPPWGLSERFFGWILFWRLGRRRLNDFLLRPSRWRCWRFL